MGNDHARRDVILQLNLDRSREILTKLIHAPSALMIQANAEIHAYKLSISVLELVTVIAVDHIDAKVFAPISIPFRLRESFDNKGHCIQMRWNAAQPSVVLVRVFVGGGRESLITLPSDRRGSKGFLLERWL